MHTKTCKQARNFQLLKLTITKLCNLDLKKEKKAMQFREMVKEIYIYIKTYFGMHVKDSSQISASKSKISKVSAIPIFPLIN